MPSGVYTFSYNRDQIIRRAARLVNAIAAGDTPGPTLVLDFSDALNAMVKEWQASGIHVWTQTEATLFLNVNQTSYTIGPSGNGRVIGTYFTTTTTAPTPSGFTIVPVANTANINIGDAVGIILDHGGIQWTTITALTSSSISIQLALQDSVQANGSLYTYTPIITIRPTRILSARRFVFASGIITPIDPPLSRQDYHNLTSLVNTGPVTQWFYDPQIPNGIMNVWPAPSDLTASLQFTYMRPLQIYQVAGDTSDFPDEWVNTLVYGLAYTMAPEFAVTESQYQMIKEQMQIHTDVSTSFDREPESIYMGVNIDHR